MPRPKALKRRGSSVSLWREKAPQHDILVIDRSPNRRLRRRNWLMTGTRGGAGLLGGLLLSLIVLMGPGSMGCSQNPHGDPASSGGAGGFATSTGGSSGFAGETGNGGAAAGGQTGGIGESPGGTGVAGTAGRGSSDAGGSAVVRGVAGAGGAAGGGGQGGDAGGHGGAGGGGGAASLFGGPCHINADCPRSSVCFISVPFTDCATAPTGICLSYFSGGNCSLIGFHGPCGCLFEDHDADSCPASSGLTCDGSSHGQQADYTPPTSCFGCFPPRP